MGYIMPRHSDDADGAIPGSIERVAIGLNLFRVRGRSAVLPPSCPADEKADSLGSWSGTLWAYRKGSLSGTAVRVPQAIPSGTPRRGEPVGAVSQPVPGAGVPLKGRRCDKPAQRARGGAAQVDRASGGRGVQRGHRGL